MYMAMPAEGPSLGMAPAGTWTWTSVLAKRSGSMPRCLALCLRREKAAWTDSFMTSPIWPVSWSVAFAGHLGGFDEEDFAADGGVGQAGDDAGGGGALGEFGFEARGAEDFEEVGGMDGDLRHGRSEFSPGRRSDGGDSTWRPRC